MGEKKLEGAGLRGQVAGNTALSTVGKTGKGLTYRGYAIEELADRMCLCFQGVPWRFQVDSRAYFSR